MNFWRVFFVLFLAAVIGICIPSFAQNGENADVLPDERNQDEDDSESLDSNPKDQESSPGNDSNGNDETSPSASDSSDSGRGSSGNENASPPSGVMQGSSPQGVAPPSFLSFQMPDAIGMVMDVNRESGVLEDVDKLGSVKSLLPDAAPPGIVSEDMLNLELLLMTKHSLSGIFPNSNLVEQSKLESIDSSLDITSLLGHINSADVFSSPLEPYSSFVGRSIKLGGGSYSVSQETFIVGATSELNYSGSISFVGSSKRVVLISGDSISSGSGSELQMESALSDLVIASRSDWSAGDAAFSAGSRLYLRSLGDLKLDNVSLTASDLVRLEALMDLSLDSATFSAGIKDIQMTATTIDLSNVDFPSSSVVKLSTLKGGVDGRYPTFGSPNRAIGRVNFLNNVSYGGKANLLHDRSSFDAFGQAIQISKLP